MAGQSSSESARGSVLIVGASGIVGSSAMEEFLSDGWDVTALSRRAPEIRSSLPFRHISVDLMDADACRKAAAELSGITHVVYAALYEKPGLVAGWYEDDQMETNLRMINNILTPLSQFAKLQHVSLMQGTKAYGIHVHKMPIPARESLPRDDHANFYFLQEDYLIATAAKAGFTYTVLRPSIVVGLAYGVPMALAAALGAYVAMCTELGEPCGYPGGPSYVWEASDARLVAQSLRWAATAPAAANEIFNVTNSDVFEWRNVWPAIVETMGGKPGPDNPRIVSKWMIENAGVWDRIVERHGLRQLTLAELLNESHFYVDMCLGCGSDKAPPPAFMSAIKIRKAGFHGVEDTQDMFVHWLKDLGERAILPKA